MIDERQEIKDALHRLATGQEQASGRALASRISALRRLELMTRPRGSPPPQESDEQADHPVDETGRFAPPLPSWWMLWRSVSSHDYAAGDEREAKAIQRWESLGGRDEWQLAGQPFSRSAWEVDRGPWERARLSTELSGARSNAQTTIPATASPAELIGSMSLSGASASDSSVLSRARTSTDTPRSQPRAHPIAAL
jgi:hypothetical protein